MDVHILLLSTMSPELTRQNLEGFGYEFKLEPSIQKFRWTPQNKSGVTVCLWVSTMHPLCTTLASSLIPYMDACVLWYHDHDVMSCVRVEGGMLLLENNTKHISLMTTVTPRIQNKHASSVRCYYDEHGFERQRFTGLLNQNLVIVLENYLSTAKTLR
jgi:hypothetical protein